MTDWCEWLNESRYERLNQADIDNSIAWLDNIRDLILINSRIKKFDTVVDIGTGTGLLGLKVLEAQQGKGNVIFLDNDNSCLEECRKQIAEKNITEGFNLLLSDCLDIKLPDNTADKVIIRSVLTHIDNKQKALSEMHRILKENGFLCALEPVISENPKFWQILPKNKITDFKLFKNTENKIWSSKTDCLVNYNFKTLKNLLKKSGFKNFSIERLEAPISIIVNDKLIDSWFHMKPSPIKPSVKERFLEYIAEAKLNHFIEEMKKELIGKSLNLKSVFALIKAEKVSVRHKFF